MPDVFFEDLGSADRMAALAGCPFVGMTAGFAAEFLVGWNDAKAQGVSALVAGTVFGIFHGERCCAGATGRNCFLVSLIGQARGLLLSKK